MPFKRVIVFAWQATAANRNASEKFHLYNSAHSRERGRKGKGKATAGNAEQNQKQGKGNRQFRRTEQRMSCQVIRALPFQEVKG